jgi:hypothetical protein
LFGLHGGQGQEQRQIRPFSALSKHNRDSTDIDIDIDILNSEILHLKFASLSS